MYAVCRFVCILCGTHKQQQVMFILRNVFYLRPFNTIHTYIQQERAKKTYHFVLHSHAVDYIQHNMRLKACKLFCIAMCIYTTVMDLFVCFALVLNTHTYMVACMYVCMYLCVCHLLCCELSGVKLMKAILIKHTFRGSV